MSESSVVFVYVPPSCDLELHDLQRSVVIYGSPGSGKRTAMRRLQTACEHRCLIVPWEPNATDSPRSDSDRQVDLYKSIRDAVAQRILELVVDEPRRLTGLTNLSRDFLPWLFSQTLRPRQINLKRRLIPELDRLYLEQQTAELYSDYSADSVLCQLDEMAVLAHDLKAEPIVLFYVAPETMPASCMAMLCTLLGWRSLLSRRDILLKAALPQRAVVAGRLDEVALNRVEFRRLHWSAPQGVQIAAAWASRLENASPSILADAFVPDLVEAAGSFLLDIYGEHLPIGWRAVAEALVDMHILHQRPLTGKDDIPELRRRLYRQLAPLRIEPDRSGVQRGIRHLKVREQPLRLLEVLRTASTEYTRNKLLEITSTENNLHKQISELRKAVEPLPAGSRDWVYICNTTERNYVLVGQPPHQPVRTPSG